MLCTAGELVVLSLRGIMQNVTQYYETTRFLMMFLCAFLWLSSCAYLIELRIVMLAN